jgi:putative transposase
MAIPVYPVYPSDLNDAEWALLAPLIPTSKPYGRPRSSDMRRITNGVFYVLRTGCARAAPGCLGAICPATTAPGKRSITISASGVGTGPGSRSMRTGANWPGSMPVGIPPRAPRSLPSSIASQSRRSWEACAALTATRSWSAANAISWSSPEGFLLAVVVPAASIPDRKGGQWGLETAAAGATYPRLQHLWADQGYTGTLVRWAEQESGWTVQVVYPADRQLKRYAPDVLADLGGAPAPAPGVHVIPRRWVVERTFSWLGRQRRLRKDDERLTSTEEAFIYLVGIRMLLARLAPA